VEGSTQINKNTKIEIRNEVKKEKKEDYKLTDIYSFIVLRFSILVRASEKYFN